MQSDYIEYTYNRRAYRIIYKLNGTRMIVKEGHFTAPVEFNLAAGAYRFREGLFFQTNSIWAITALTAAFMSFFKASDLTVERLALIIGCALLVTVCGRLLLGGYFMFGFLSTGLTIKLPNGDKIKVIKDSSNADAYNQFVYAIKSLTTAKSTPGQSDLYPVHYVPSPKPDATEQTSENRLEAFSVSMLLNERHFTSGGERFLRQLGMPRAIWCGCVVLSLFLTGLFCILKYWDNALPLAFLTVVLLIGPRHILKRSCKEYFYSPDYNSRSYLEFKRDGCHATDRAGYRHLPWTAFKKAVYYPDGILLILGTFTYIWIPLSSIQPPASAEALVGFLRENISPYRVIK